MPSSADPAYPSSGLGLLEQALQDAFEAGYNQCMHDIRDKIDKMIVDHTGSTPVVTIVGHQQSWPTLTNQLISFNGKELVITAQFARAFKRLLDERGGIVTQAEMLAIYNGSKMALFTNISRLRQILTKSMPEIRVETIGKDYRLVVDS